jgi:hypothetical protein
MKLLAVVLLVLPLAACGGLPSGAASTPVGAQGAQNIGGDQGLGQAPLTADTGDVHIILKNASELPPEIVKDIVSLAAAEKWSADQLAKALSAAAGAPQNVTQNIGDVSVTTGAADQAGAAGGTSGAGSIAPNPERP